MGFLVTIVIGVVGGLGLLTSWPRIKQRWNRSRIGINDVSFVMGAVGLILLALNVGLLHHDLRILLAGVGYLVALTGWIWAGNTNR